MIRFVFFVVALFLVLPAGASPILYVDDRALLTELESKGYAFEDVFGAEAGTGLSALQASSPAYRSIVSIISQDVAELRAEMKAGGRVLFEVTDGNVGRVMDMRWLATDAARFRLVGLVNRMDRRDFADLRGEAGCGEVRLIYRLAYRFTAKKRTMASRMPFNFNAVYSVLPDEDGGCEAAAARWTPGLDEALDAGWLAGGALDKAGLRLKQIELNAQVVRFPSGQETEFGGQAAYLMRIFGLDGDTVTERPLENTPDAALLSSDAALRAELAAYVRDNVAAVDLGVYEIPEKFLARKVVSYSTFGSVRLANRPFEPLFDPADFADVAFDGMRLLKTPQALLARLENGSCQGCHQAGSTAGFHFIGKDDADSSPLNRIEVGLSPHVAAELPRREAWLAAVAAGNTPDRFRQLSSAPPAEWLADTVAYRPAKAGMSCLLPEEADGFASGWDCEAGLACTALASASGVPAKLGQCLLPPDSPNMFSGHPCVTGEIATNATQPFNDRMTVSAPFTAKAAAINRETYNCRPPKIGVPAGIAYRACTDRDRTFADFRPGKPEPREICGLAGGKAFDLCVATNDFESCLGAAVVRGNRPTCSADMFCREDYMCQAFPPDTPGIAKVKGKGFCSPTYFIFQMRIDNHPTPW
ncbi:hypothetical protein [Mesorhizobium sp. J428]|uniref:hypothetical protein n=1 Tax=Mesorhizobium sp. J428 TaxID=2898440 RepID=UPI002150C81B|nr:hypothetical protein [Mesorhizobium sp. J428]MCR5859980.1 hypothetical protein [Mesorhizobium sp. J428]